MKRRAPALDREALCRGNRGPVEARYRRTPRALEGHVRKGAFPRNRPVLSDSRDRLPSPGAGLSADSNPRPADCWRGSQKRPRLEFAEETPDSNGPIGNHPDSRMARDRSPGDDARRRSVLQREALPFALRSRTRDHRQSVVGAAVLWTEVARDGEQPWSNLRSPIRRCAIYTRKSSEEGLEQDFNSLHAQREACEAFIKSQAGEGWRLVKTAYDDGGLSGGTMERPALQRLLADINQGLIDVVVVYKVDRLTRSLTDFAKMVEVFDARGVSFVAVTQQFNTTTSMGRLTLNVLLSFAQFEREVTGERIRDKIAASKQKGMWMGGLVPIGYDVIDRRLVVNQSEAETVREIFRRYLELGSVRLLMEDLNRRGIRSKVRVAKNGKRSGGNSFFRGALYAAAFKSHLHRRDSSQGRPPSGPARTDRGSGAVGRDAAAAAKPRGTACTTSKEISRQVRSRASCSTKAARA